MSGDTATWAGAVGTTVAAVIAAYAAFQAREAAKANVIMANAMREDQQQARQTRIGEMLGALTALRAECDDVFRRYDDTAAGVGRVEMTVWEIKKVEVQSEPKLYEVAYALNALERDVARINAAIAAGDVPPLYLARTREKVTVAAGLIEEGTRKIRVEGLSW
jgi:hypothetical protein